MPETITPHYRAIMALTTPAVKWWGRLKVEGLEHLPADGPILLAANHDSYWDPVAIGLAAMPKRQIHALAKSSLWKPGTGWILDGMGQIPIQRGKGDARALDSAIDALKAGACIGVFPEGTRSLGRELRARSGFGRLAAAVPEAAVVLAECHGAWQVPDLSGRPEVRVRFFLPRGGGLQPGEDPGDFTKRLILEVREGAPIAIAGRKRRAAAAAGTLPDQPTHI
jgi:1-acyl-sn-glycerol-3-phosphate acyltransferase